MASVNTMDIGAILRILDGHRVLYREHIIAHIDFMSFGLLFFVVLRFLLFVSCEPSPKLHLRHGVACSHWSLEVDTGVSQNQWP